ncbi:MAG TPA: CBS domain-containing protein, partial [Nitrospiria bacterium]
MRRTEYLTEKREFQNLKAGVIMEREVVKAVPSDTGRTIAKQMTEKNIGSLPVVDEEGVLVGLVSEFDLLKHLLNEADLETVTAEQL